MANVSVHTVFCVFFFQPVYVYYRLWNRSASRECNDPIWFVIYDRLCDIPGQHDLEDEPCVRVGGDILRHVLARLFHPQHDIISCKRYIYHASSRLLRLPHSAFLCLQRYRLVVLSLPLHVIPRQTRRPTTSRKPYAFRRRCPLLPLLCQHRSWQSIPWSQVRVL